MSCALDTSEKTIIDPVDEEFPPIFGRLSHLTFVFGTPGPRDQTTREKKANQNAHIKTKSNTRNKN